MKWFARLGRRLTSARALCVLLLDPAAVLKRGYAWLRRADGSLLKDAGAAQAGETLTGVLRDGELGLRVQPHPTGAT